LRVIVADMAEAAKLAQVAIVTGDTKVVNRGAADGLYITTSGLGFLPEGRRLGPDLVRPGDRVLVSGTIGDHGTAVLVARGELALEVDLESDSAPVHELAGALLRLGGALRCMRDPTRGGVAIMLARGEFELAAEVCSDTRSLWPAVDALLESAGPSLRCIRDATRGGVASVLNELARASGVAAVIREAAVPVAAPVVGACEILGIDPLYVANEGVFVAIADRPLDGFADIGEVKTEPPGMVLVETAFGGRRVMDQLVGDPLARIC